MEMRVGPKQMAWHEGQEIAYVLDETVEPALFREVYIEGYKLIAL